MNHSKTERTKKGKAMKIVAIIFAFLIILIVLALLFFGNYRRNYCSGKCPSWMWECAYAHRGIHADDKTDENSMGAFVQAVEAGYAIELDLRYTKDNVPMVCHDNDLSRIVGKEIKLSDISYEEARTLRYVESGEQIASLEEVLEYIDGRVPLLIEIKAYHIPGEFEKNIVDQLSGYKGQFAIQSYNPLALNYVKKLNPEITIGLLSDDVPGLPPYKRARILKDNLFGAMCHPAFITYNAKLIEDHELDLFRSEDNILLGFLYSEEDIETKSYTDKVDGIVFERTGPRS